MNEKFTIDQLKVWVHKNKSTPPLFILDPAPRQANKRLYIGVLGVSGLPISLIGN